MTTLINSTIFAGTGVEHSVVDSFIEGSNDLQVVTSIKNTMCVYTMQGERVQLIEKETLQANITILDSVTFNNKTFLILVFCNAKVGIMEFNKEINKFEIYSLHCLENYPEEYFREEENQERVNSPPTTSYEPRLYVDPKGRCLTLIVFDSVMWIIPLGDRKFVL